MRFSHNLFLDRSYEGVLSIKNESYASCGRGLGTKSMTLVEADRSIRAVLGGQISDLRASERSESERKSIDLRTGGVSR